MYNFNNMTCSVRVLVASRKHAASREKLKEQLEEMSSTSLPVTVVDWYEARGKGFEPEQLECCAFVIITDGIMKKATGDSFSSVFQVFLNVLVGVASPLTQETVVFLHISERILIRTLCDSFSLKVKDFVDMARKEGLSYFSLADDFKRSRWRKSQTDFVLRVPKLLAPKALEMRLEPVVKISWLAMIVEPDKQTAEDLKCFLANKALRQNINLRIDVRHNVEDAIRGLSALTPFAVSVKPHLVEEWDGLEILAVAKKFDIPVVLRTSRDPKRIQGALNQRRIAGKPTKTVSENLALPWAEAMLACLISQTRH